MGLARSQPEIRLATPSETSNMAKNFMQGIDQMYDTYRRDSTELYNQAIQYISGFQFHGFRLGLERMEAIAQALDNPHKRYPCIHVAGTNGKGSVCAFLESIFIEAGLKVGLYTSPHLHCLEERFRMNREKISKGELAELIFKIKRLVEQGYELSYFEYTTIIAMDWFAKKGVDIAIFETGLGGRLDATNIVYPKISIITNISLEHQAFLGDDLGQIAWEKAGIIKESRPVVCGVREKEALAVIRQRAEELGASLYLLGRDFDYTPLGGEMMDFSWNGREYLKGLRLGLTGRHQMENASLAISASLLLKETHLRGLTQEAISQGLKGVKWPGRGEIVTTSKGRIILDGAHNRAGILSLRRLLQEDGHFSRANARILLWAMSDEGGDKDFTGLLGLISDDFDRIIITEPPGPRHPVTIDEWRAKLGKENRFKFEGNWSAALKRALAYLSNDSVLVVAGSLYLIGAVREVLKGGVS